MCHSKTMQIKIIVIKILKCYSCIAAVNWIRMLNPRLLLYRCYTYLLIQHVSNSYHYDGFYCHRCIYISSIFFLSSLSVIQRNIQLCTHVWLLQITLYSLNLCIRNHFSVFSFSIFMKMIHISNDIGKWKVWKLES